MEQREIHLAMSHHTHYNENVPFTVIHQLLLISVIPAPPIQIGTRVSVLMQKPHTQSHTLSHLLSSLTVHRSLFLHYCVRCYCWNTQQCKVFALLRHKFQNKFSCTLDPPSSKQFLSHAALPARPLPREMPRNQ